jgi:hypothetical protein
MSTLTGPIASVVGSGMWLLFFWVRGMCGEGIREGGCGTFSVVVFEPRTMYRNFRPVAVCEDCSTGGYMYLPDEAG